MPEDPITVVYVEWMDSHGGSGQYNVAEVKKKGPDVMYTAGLLLYENEVEIMLAQDLFKLGDEEPQVRQFLGILKANIIRTERWIMEQKA